MRNGFTADHSSTSYEFLAIDRPLDAEEQAQVAKLSRRAEPTDRHVSFTYQAEGYDIPGGWEALMSRYYDVMVSESYDWWTFAMAFHASQEQQQEITRYEFYGADDLGVRVFPGDDRVIVEIYCILDMNALYELSTIPGRRKRGEDNNWTALLPLLSAIRQQLIAGDYRSLYAVWEEYGYEEEEGEAGEGEEVTIPPEPPSRESGQDIIERLCGLLSTL
jgi:hypothetical protein